MTSHFKNEYIATSARGEALLNELKNSILENRKPLRCDNIVIKHCRQINGDIILARAAINDIHLPFEKETPGKNWKRSATRAKRYKELIEMDQEFLTYSLNQLIRNNYLSTL